MGLKEESRAAVEMHYLNLFNKLHYVLKFRRDCLSRTRAVKLIIKKSLVDRTLELHLH